MVSNSFYSRHIIAAGDVSGSPILLKRFRGKVAKEIYRCGKSIAVTRSISKPVIYALISVPGELANGFVKSSIGNTAETVIGYISGVGFVRFVYKNVHPGKLKTAFRLTYNIICLPMTLYAKGVSGTLELLQVSKLEEMWFGEKVPIFTDNSLWVEKNFTLSEVFNSLNQHMLDQPD